MRTDPGGTIVGAVTLLVALAIFGFIIYVFGNALMVANANG